MEVIFKVFREKSTLGLPIHRGLSKTHPLICSVGHL